MSKSSDIEASLNREALHFDVHMLSICNHIQDLVRNYGANYALVYWLSDNDQLKKCTTVNLGWRDAISDEIFSAFKKKSTLVLQKNTLTLFPKCAKVIWGSGTSSPKENAQGWWNKKRSINRKILNFERLGYRLPAIIVVRGGERSLSFCFPPRDQELMRLAKRIDDHYGVSLELQGKGLPPNPPRLPSAPKKRSIFPKWNWKNSDKKRWRPSSTRQEIEEFLGMEHIHDPGSLAWYSNQLKSSDSVPVHPLYETENLYQWACLDARVYGDNLATHHNMFVQVDLSKDANATISCSCDVYRHCIVNPCCVHTEYIRINAGKLRQLEFGEPGEVLQLCKNNGDIVGYYVNGCFVRRQGNKGYRCDTDKMYSCQHVNTVCGELGLDEGPEALKERAVAESSEDSEDEVEAEHLPTNAWITQHLKHDKIIYPYTQEMANVVTKNAFHGYGMDKEHPCMWFGGVLKPDVPGTKCLCMLDYRDEDMKLEDYLCTVYMKEPHCARQMPCMSLECPNGRKACTRHYAGLQHGLWRIGQARVVELDLLVKCALNIIHFPGASFAAQCDQLSESYDFYKLHGGNTEGFLDVNSFRAAVYDVAKRLDIDFSELQQECQSLSGSEMTHMNMMLCPICKDRPDVIIMDGTSMTINARSCSAPSITSPWGDETKIRPHAMLDRCFFNVVKDRSVGRSRCKRKRVINLLQGFEAWFAPCKISRRDYKDINELLELSKAWRLDGFIKWAYQACREATVSNQKRKAVQRVLRELASSSPAASYLPYASAKVLKEHLDVQEVPPNAMQRLGPCLKGLLQAGCKQNENGAIFPSSWTPFLAELAQRSMDTYESPYCQQEYGLGGEISHHGDPSILHDGYLESGICCGLPRLRHRPRYACDNIQDDTEYMGRDKPPCKHAFGKAGTRTGGVFTCMCKHGITYGCFIIKEAEGRNEPFTFLTCFLKEAPKIVIYDFACSLMDYCLNRAPGYFKHTLFFVDKFHWVNHVSCARTFNIREHSEDKFVVSSTGNSEACEQLNAAMKRLRFVLSRMAQRPFMIFLRLFVAVWNKKKLEKVKGLHDRGQAARVCTEAGPAAAPT
eukprot:jgi/Picsp_1/4018/NSC_01530-R1_protein